MSAPFSPSQQVNEAQRLAVEYVGQEGEPGHERRCTTLLAALAWTHCQFSQIGGADIKLARRDLIQHLARSCREEVDAEALADTLASLCVVNARNSQFPGSSPVHVLLAREVLATLDTRVDAHELLSDLIRSLSGEHDNGVDELYRSALCAWVAIGPQEWGDKGGRAIAKDRILNMADGKLDLRGLGLDCLPELPAGLTSLDVSCNNLTELPALPVGLVTLDASVNQLTQLPELPEGLTTLNVCVNQLPYLPELPTSLTGLGVRDNRLTKLPELPKDLTWLSAYNNQLTRLPALPTSLTELWVYCNQLTELPDLPASLALFDASCNQLTRLPPSVLSMPHDGQVYVENNPFSPAHLQRLRVATSVSRYSGPQIHFSVEAADVSIATARPLPEAVRDWFNSNEQAQVHRWRAHSEEAHAAEFSLFLDRLKVSVNYHAGFKMAVASWLSQLAQDGELRQLAFQTVQGATESCEDRVALTYNNLTKLSHAHAVTRGEYDARLDEIVDRGLGAFRLDALEKIARKKAQTLPLVDEIEVYLAYQVQLRDRLKLPTDIADMRFFHVSGVVPKDLRDAEQEVRAQESAEFPQYFLVEWEPWQQVLARLDPEGTERARRKLQDILPAYEQEMAARLANLRLPEDPDTQAQVGVGIMKAQQLEVYKELTREFLRKRDKEALMDQIMSTGGNLTPPSPPAGWPAFG
ncbi:NEL-type E3 ubiquitin ligase domain-containing protein [Pandoraea horticolens]|uniref:NEL-type E3 ubiquitin ligase domain-containing protein n=1 Tax=Pandoraea horticolens TaxID=2508298 RepID=UPI0015826DD5|nr:NEL-type E3 ubiquitin ligase domain-containing protein [Pandoraea horticolens]